MCDSAGIWSFHSSSRQLFDLTACEFESNLTRFLQDLTYINNNNNNTNYIKNHIHLNTANVKKMFSLDKLITYLVKSDSFNRIKISRYDILYIQRFILALVFKNNNNNNNNLLLDSFTWRRQFIWLNDLLARLSPIELKYARQIDANTFNLYFSQCVMPVLTRDFLIAQKFGSLFEDGRKNGKQKKYIFFRGGWSSG